MGWDVSLEDRTAPPITEYGYTSYPTVTVAPHTEGGTITLGGTSDASVNITYNYGQLYRLVLPDPTPDESDILGRLLGGKRAGDVIPMLEAAIEKLGTQTYTDYWAPTPGNAGHMLNVLLGWARQHPDAVFSVS